MVTIGTELARKYTLEIRQGNARAITVTITDEHGKFQTYEVDRTKLRIFAMTNPAARDVLDFLLGVT